MTDERWDDLRERLQAAAVQLQSLADDTTIEDRRTHLLAKREGVTVALSYMDEWDRTHV